LPVAVPACAAVCGNSEAATSAAISIREVVNIFQLPVFGVKTVPASPLALPSEQLSQTIESIAWLVSIGAQSGPRIGIQEGPHLSTL
jgi:hypothetical protein